MAFEFITGNLPFNDDSWQKIHKNIIERNFVVGDGKGYLSDNAYDFVMKLLDPDPKKRLGAHGAAEVKSHPYFAHINW